MNHDSLSKFFPNTFFWLDQVAVETLRDTNNNAYQVIPATTTQTNPADAGSKESKTTLDCSYLPEQTAKNLLDQMKTACWNAKLEPTTFIVENQAFAIVPKLEAGPTIQQRSRQFGLNSAAAIKKRAPKQVALHVGKELHSIAVLEGFIEGLYDLQSFKNSSSAAVKLPEKIYLESRNGISSHEISDCLHRLKGTALTRMVCDAPPNWLNSERFAELAQWVANDLGLKCKILGRSEITDLNMGAFESVAKGTDVDPKLITLEIPGKDKNRWVSLVGKGLTFDAGGISIKPSAGMAEMKYDLCGGAAVLGAAYDLAKKQPPTNVVCVIGAVENMPGREATRPGDIVTAMNGKTIEVLNTDAEGRMVLADLLHYVNTNYQPEFIINAATLTGAVLIALGSVGAAVMGNHENLCQYILKNAENMGERIWQLPLWSEFDKEVKSNIADLKNIASSKVRAGSIMGGAFLKEFVGKTPWAHLDIAGMAFSKYGGALNSGGATGFGVRLLNQLVEENYE